MCLQTCQVKKAFMPLLYEQKKQAELMPDLPNMFWPIRLLYAHSGPDQKKHRPRRISALRGGPYWT